MRCALCNNLITKPIRTTQQNRYYFGVLIALLSEHLGYAPTEMHEVLKAKWLSEKKFVQNKRYGIMETIEISKSTTEISTVEFEAYLSKCRQWGSELGCYVPMPNEVISENI